MALRIIPRKYKNLDKEVSRILIKEHPTYIDKDGNQKFYDYTYEIHDDIIYVKFYYEDSIAYSNVEKLYRDAIQWFLKIGFNFQGLIEYRDNHEICFTFLK